MQRTNPTATRRSRGALARRLALGLSLALVAGAFALPALADDGPKTFTANVSATEGPNFRFTVTLKNTSTGGDGLELGSANITVPSGIENVDDVTIAPPNRASAHFDEDSATVQARRMSLAPGHSASITFTASSDCSAGPYPFAVAAKQSNNFNGTGNDLVLANGPDESLTVTLECQVSDDPFGGQFAPEEIESCDPDDATDTCSIDANGTTSLFTATADRQKDAQIGFRIPDVNDGVTAAVSAACDQLITEITDLGGVARLGGNVAHLLPVGFKDGDITVTTTILKSFVNEDVNRSANIFQVCVAPEKANYAGYELHPIDGTTLFGPILLDECTSDDQAACIISRQKVKADVVLTFRIPAEDPFLQ